MPRVTTVQASNTYGVLDPLVIERRDTKFLAASLSAGDNIVILPQGGYTDRGGTTDFGRARRVLTAIALNTGLTDMPNGGTEADLLAGTETTVTGATGSRFVIVEVDFGTATKVHMIDVKKIAIATTPADDALVAEYWDGAAWQTFGQTLKLTLDARSRRFASGAPGHAGVTATKFRIAVDATTAAGDVTLSGLALFVESATLADGVLWKFQPEQGMPHQFLVTPGNIDVYDAGVWQAAIAAPVTAAILRQVKPEARFDTLLAFHMSMRPQKITRLGASDEWACDDVVFKNMPRADYGGVYTNGVNEQQWISFFSFSALDQFEIILEGQTTTAIYFTGDAGTATNIASALEALPNVAAGITVTMSPSFGIALITFTGGDNAGRDWLQLRVNTLSGGGYAIPQTVVQGKPPGEDIISDAAGWPAVGRFAQQRLLMAGLKSQPKSVLASVTGDPYNLNVEIDSAIAAFSYDVDMPENSAIRDIVVGRTLVFLGDAQTAYLKNQVLSAADTPNFGVSDAPGVAAGVPYVSSSNALFYVDAAGETVQVVNFNQLEDNLVADNASVLSAFLVGDPVDMTRRRAADGIASDVLTMVNADGTITALTMMRTQEVSGFAPWSTDGAFAAAMVDHGNTGWFLARRAVDGTTELRLEKQEPAKLLDEAVELTFGPATAAITGLSRFNGREVWATANDQVFGPFTVAGGAIDLPETVTAVRVGTWRPATATDTPVSLAEELRQRTARYKRVNRAVLSVYETTSVAISANGGPLHNVPLRANEDTEVNEGPLARPFTGNAEAEGMHGFTEHGKLTVGQAFPGFLTVRSATKNVVA